VKGKFLEQSALTKPITLNNLVSLAYPTWKAQILPSSFEIDALVDKYGRRAFCIADELEMTVFFTALKTWTQTKHHVSLKHPTAGMTWMLQRMRWSLKLFSKSF